jgi:hypothetical protein
LFLEKKNIEGATEARTRLVADGLENEFHLGNLFGSAGRRALKSIPSDNAQLSVDRCATEGPEKERNKKPKEAPQGRGATVVRRTPSMPNA